MDLQHLAYHAAVGEDYDVALFVHAMRERTGTQAAPIDYRALSNMLSNECYQEVHAQALGYAVKGQASVDIAKKNMFHDMCSFARRLRNNAWKAQYIKEYMDCFA